MKNDYYTYAYLREDGTPYYIGKGRGYRAYYKHRQLVRQPPVERILFLKRNLTEEEAHKHEVYMIAVLGRKDLGTGILRNLTNGGEGTSGWRATPEFREKRRQMRLGQKHSEETKRKIGEGNRGKKVSKETREKLRRNTFRNNGWFWINNGEQETMVAPTETLPEGWEKGRKKKVR
jgi:hypothetical protein